MKTVRLPILLHETAGFHTAVLVEDHEDLAAYGSTESQALNRLQKYCTWRARTDWKWLDSDLEDPKLVTFAVRVHTTYREGIRLFPAKEPITLQVPCVYGKHANGLGFCSLPTLGIRFSYFPERGALRRLVTSYVTENLKGLTPQEAAPFLGPDRARLDTLVVRGEFRGRPATDDDQPTLTAVAEPLLRRARGRRRGGVWERDPLIEQVTSLLQRERCSVLLVGDGGVGKTTILTEAAGLLISRLKKDGHTETESGRLFWTTNAGRLIAGMRYLGQWQERCETIIEELSQLDGLLCIENLLDLARAGGREPRDSIAAFLHHYIERGELRLIAEATPAELEAVRRLLPGLSDSFHTVRIPALEPDESMRVLGQIALTGQRSHRIQWDGPLPQVIQALFSRYASYGAFPGKSSEFMVKLINEVRRKSVKRLTADHVYRMFSRDTGLPESILRADQTLNPADVLESFRAQVIGQEAACQAAADLVTVFKAGLNDPGRPIGTFLFCGPTGVGKTEMAKAMARYFFGQGQKGERMVRLDMSELSGPLAGERLIGSLSGEPSEFIRQMRAEPFSIVLFDEIEKAAPEAFDVLLSVLDEGRLADPYGRVTSFRSAIIIMTSNIGADTHRPVGFHEAGTESYGGEVQAFFRPEFVNRIDHIVTFSPLSRAAIRAIAQKELQEVVKREGLAARGLRLKWNEDLVDLLCSKGYDERYGARPLLRAIDSIVVTPLSRLLVDDPELCDCTLVVSRRSDSLAAFDLE